jgi:anti-sigma factor RsiW
MNSDPPLSPTPLQAAYRRATLDCPLGGDGCPSPEELSATARGGLDPAQRERMLALLANCARCAALVQVAAELESTAPTTTPRAPRPRSWVWLGAAATAVFAVLLVAPWRSPVPGPTRGEAAAVEPAPDAILAAPPAELRWSPVAGLACRATLRSDDAEILAHSTSVLDGRFALDADTRARLVRGGYLWSVECGATRLGP